MYCLIFVFEGIMFLKLFSCFTQHTEGSERQIFSFGPLGQLTTSVSNYIHTFFLFLFRLIFGCFAYAQTHAFIKKFEDKDIDLSILVGSLEPPVNFPR